MWVFLNLKTKYRNVQKLFAAIIDNTCDTQILSDSLHHLVSEIKILKIIFFKMATISALPKTNQRQF